jgi:mRNA-degrading endonuclease RelE of RelBE toxin-antitoxin system
MPETARERLIEEIKDLPPEAQEKIVKLVHFLKEEILTGKKIGKPASVEDLQSLIPKMNLGKIRTSLRREEIYDDAR